MQFFHLVSFVAVASYAAALPSQQGYLKSTRTMSIPTQRLALRLDLTTWIQFPRGFGYFDVAERQDIVDLANHLDPHRSVELLQIDSTTPLTGPRLPLRIYRLRSTMSEVMEFLRCCSRGKRRFPRFSRQE
ncbi:hypothetical protein BASA81_013722 [Batrachochytrium salamandrivorans]|nr:hypothetical protein BASA81_013722 [Batrachochytrium salamandrivorans]